MSPHVSSAPLLSLVEPVHADALEQLFRTVVLEPGQVLFEEGKSCDSLWVLGEGVQVSVTRAGEAPGQVVLAHLGAGDTVGEMALVDEGPRSGTARVLVGGPASVLAALDFYALRDAYHPAAFQLLRKVCLELCARLRGSSDRLAAVSSGPAQAKAPLRTERTDARQLEELPTFRTLPSVVKLALAQKLGRLDAEDGTTVCTEGEAADAAYFIVSGAVQVQRGGYPLARLEAGGGVRHGGADGRRPAFCKLRHPGAHPAVPAGTGGLRATVLLGQPLRLSAGARHGPPAGAQCARRRLAAGSARTLRPPVGRLRRRLLQ